MTFDHDVLGFLAEILASVTLNVAGDDFEEKAELAIRAKRQVRQALETQVVA